MTSRRRAGLVGLLAGAVVSQTGSRVSMVAVPWLVLVTTGSAARTGLVAFAEMLPYVLVQVFAAPVVDRFGGRRVSVVCDVVSAGVLALVPLLYDAGRLPFWLLCVLVAVVGAFRGPGENAKHVLVPEIVAEARMPMERGAGLLDGTMRLGSLLGAPLGGALAATVGAGNAIVADAASFLVAAVLVGCCVLRHRERPETLPDKPSGVRGYLHDLGEGLGVAFRDPLLRAIGLMVLVTNLFDQAYVAVLLPVWAKDTFGTAAVVGLVAGASGLGAVLGNVTFSAVSHRMPRRMTYAVCFLITGGPRYLLMIRSHSLTVVVAGMVLCGFASGAINPLLGATEYERIPQRLRARVLGAVGSLAWAGIPVGGLVGGWLVTGVGISWALAAVGTAYLVTTLAPFVRPAWRLMDRDRVSLTPAAATAAGPSSPRRGRAGRTADAP
ncbi:MAG: MFS transporter [Streptosporangiales bacterium]|nr:MFS transporter [Streptosporangiales bacterium]MBO0889378.1 MFS transporter [Acidothermales bacterium]